VEQVIVNLVVNARDALGGGGHIRVGVSAEEIGGPDPGSVRPPGRFGVLSVRDDGVGMTAEVLAHVFEPFYTTKGHGTGLGLSTVYGIARQHGGFVEAQSEPGQGAVFRVFFPEAADDERPRTPSPVPAADPLPLGNETLLLAEDEDTVRDVTALVLQRLGYQVLAAANGAAALELARAHPGPIHALVTDVVMPHMNGRELAERLGAIRPGLPVLYVSGHPQEVLSPKGVLELGIAFLRKPFEPTDLAQAVRRVLDRARGAGRGR
jgi:CheY-like chemotaxis protein